MEKRWQSVFFFFWRGPMMVSGKSGLDWARLWTALDLLLGGYFFFAGGGWGRLYYFFLICKRIAFSTFPQQDLFFHLEGGGRRVVLYRLRSP